MKRVLIFLIALSLFNLPANSFAQLQNESLVIIDTAINSDQADITGNIKYEVCVLDYYLCPNGQKFMEDKGAAYLSPRFMSDNGFNHGSQMVAAALKTNPNLQIVFIRIVANSDSGSRLNVTPLAVARALKWVYDNKERFNIAAVSMSQGHHNLTTRTIYCPTENSLETMADQLLQKGVPLFVPAGNSRDYERLDWPACYPSTISIGALDANRQIASYGNLDSKLLDFFEVGDLKVKDFDGVERSSSGTSISVQVAAAKWMKIIELNPNRTYEERMSILIKSCTPVSNSRITNGLALPPEIEDPEVRIELANELDQIRSQLSELQSLIYVLLAALLK